MISAWWLLTLLSLIPMTVIAFREGVGEGFNYLLGLVSHTSKSEGIRDTDTILYIDQTHPFLDRVVVLREKETQ